MSFKFFFYSIGLTLSILLVYILYETPIIINSWPTKNTQYFFASSSPPPTRRFAIFSASIHSELRSYIFYTPIAAAAWQRIGYEVIVIFVGDFNNYNNETLLSQLNLSRAFLQRSGAQIINFQCDASYAVKMSQLVRIFAGFVPDVYVRDKDIIITTDSDIIPMLEQGHQPQNNSDGFIYDAFCCGTFKRREKTYQIYQISHVCLRKKLWRDLFLESIQRKELLASSLSSSDSLSDKAPFSFDTISIYTRHEFGLLYDSNMTKGDAAWSMDQIFSSMLLNDYCEKHPNIKIDKRPKTLSRLDPHISSELWVGEKFKEYGDAHLIHDEIFDSYRWGTLKNLLSFLFNSSLVDAFDLYHKQFVLTLRDKPLDQ